MIFRKLIVLINYELFYAVAKVKWKENLAKYRAMSRKRGRSISASASFFSARY